jgi:transposase
VAWARPGSGFTLLFEALVMVLAKEMPIRALAGLVGEHDTRVWQIVHHYVEAARARQDLSDVRRLGVDETSFRRGQDYVTVFADIDRSRAIFATEGRDASTYAAFVKDLAAHGGHGEQITESARTCPKRSSAARSSTSLAPRSPSTATTSGRS